MANVLALCFLVITIFCCTELSFARKAYSEVEECTGDRCRAGLGNNSDVYCETCTNLVHIGEILLQNEQVQKAVEFGTDLVCDLVPFGMNTQCSELVGTYVPLVFEMIASIMQNACSFIGICPTQNINFLK